MCAGPGCAHVEVLKMAVHARYGDSDFIITPRDLLWLMLERDKRVREKQHDDVESNTEDADGKDGNAN